MTLPGSVAFRSSGRCDDLEFKTYQTDQENKDMVALVLVHRGKEVMHAFSDPAPSLKR